MRSLHLLLKLIFVIKVVQYLFFFQTILLHIALAGRHGITIITAFISTSLIVEPDYLSQRRMVPEWCLLPLSLNSISSLESTSGGFISILTYQPVSALLHIEESVSSGEPWWFEHFQLYMPVLGELYVFHSLLVPVFLSKFLIGHVRGQFRLVIIVALI